MSFILKHLSTEILKLLFRSDFERGDAVLRERRQTHSTALIFRVLTGQLSR